MKGLFASLLGGAPERRMVDLSPWASLLAGWGSKTGVSVSIENALSCSTVLACTQAIACGVAMLPLGLYQGQADGGRKEATGEPVHDILTVAPNDWQTSVEFYETLLIHAVLAGDGYAFKNIIGGELKELIPILPGQCTPKQAPDYALTYQITFADGSTQTLSRELIFHLRAPSWNAYSGLQGVRLAREAIGLSLATEETHARLHGNGARPGGILTTEKTLDQGAVDQIKAAWQEAQGGIANAMKTAVLSGGMTWQQMAMTGVDSQHLETRRFQIEEICRHMGVFPQMVGYSDKTATFASAEAFFIAHVVHTLNRWTTRLEKRIAHDLLTADQRRRGLYAKFSLQALLRGDNKTRAEFYKALVLLGIMTRNEARLLEDMNPLPGLDVPLTPISNASLQDKGGSSSGQAAALAREIRTLLGGTGSDLERRIGRVLSSANEALIRGAKDNLDQVLQQLAGEAEDA